MLATESILPGRETLTLFFTAGTGIADWVAAGTLERELAVYRRLLPELKAVNLISYGGARDSQYADTVCGFNLCPVSWRRRQSWTAAEAALRYSGRLASSGVFKTNQMRGAIIPVWLKKLYRRKLIVRCGFLHSFFTEKQTTDSERIRQARQLESAAFAAADMVFLTSAWQKDFVLERYGIDPELVKIVPNYVQTDLFQPLPEVEKLYDLVFVGRGTDQKNLEGLFEALSRLRGAGREVSLLMIGSCCDRRDLRELAEAEKIHVEFAGQVATRDLPGMLNQARAYILPSHYEGHPKTLLEAMSCGMACIGTNVEGIRGEIEHGHTGWVCEPDGESIARAVGALLDDPELAARLGEAARRWIVDNFTLDKVAGMELNYIRQLTSQN